MLVTSRRNKVLVKELSTPSPGQEDLYFPTKYSRSTWEQFTSCLWKQRLSYWRTPDYNLVRFFFTGTVAIILGAVFWKIGAQRSVLITRLLNPCCFTVLLQTTRSFANSSVIGSGKEAMSYTLSLEPW